MKIRAVYFFTLVLICSAGVACGQFTRARLQVAGINCALCAKTTERELRALPFISDVKPDLMHNIYVLIFKAGVPVNFDQIGKVVHDENFFINFLKPTVNFDEVKLNGDAITNGAGTYRFLNPQGKPLNGQLEFIIVDKGFAPRSVTKKYLGAVAEDPSAAGRVYHLVI